MPVVEMVVVLLLLPPLLLLSLLMSLSFAGCCEVFTKKYSLALLSPLVSVYMLGHSPLYLLLLLLLLLLLPCYNFY